MSTTQTQIDVLDIAQDIILLKDGSASLVMQASAVNFGLLSEEEQDATIYAYAAFLNSLTFSVQILIRSNVKDISDYTRQLEEQALKQTNPIKKQKILSYQTFINSLITERNVLEKKFYLVIPFSTLELGAAKSVVSQLKPTKTLPFDKTYILEKAKLNLEPKRDHVLRQLGRIGLTARQLTTQELIQLVFSMYNPSSSQGQKISNAADYTTPLVQPAFIKSQENAMSDAPNTTPDPVNPVPPVAPTETPAMPTTPDPTTPPTPMAPDPTPAAPTTPEPITPVSPTEPVAPTTPPPAAPPVPSLTPTPDPAPTTSPTTPPPPPTNPLGATDTPPASPNEAQDNLNAAIGNLK